MGVDGRIVNVVEGDVGPYIGRSGTDNEEIQQGDTVLVHSSRGKQYIFVKKVYGVRNVGQDYDTWTFNDAVWEKSHNVYDPHSDPTVTTGFHYIKYKSFRFMANVHSRRLERVQNSRRSF